MGNTGVLTDLKVFINTQPLVEAGKLGAEAIGNLANRLRILGRDVLRISGVINRFGQFFGGIFRFMADSSLSLGGAIEDIQWAFEDIAGTIGDVLAPIFDWLAEVMNKVADIIEGMPDWMKGLIGGFLLFGLVASQVAKVILDLAGLFWLLKGSFMGTSSEVSKSWALLGKLAGVTSTTAESAQRLIEINSALAEKQIALAQAAEKYRIAQFAGTKEAASAKASMVSLGDEVAALKAEREGLIAGEKKQAAAQKKTGKGVTGMVSSLAKAGAWMIILTTIMLVLGPLLELLEPIFEALGDAFEALLEPLQPIIDAIADWIEQNPELAASIVLGIVAALVALLLLKDPLISLLTGATKEGGGLLGMVKSGGKDLLYFAAAIAIIALSLVPLILAFTEFLKVMVENNITIPQVIGYLFALGAAIIFIVGILMVLAVILQPTIPLMAALALVLLAVAAAALLFGLAILLAGLGVKAAAEGISSLVNYIPQVLILIPAIFALALAFGLLGLSLLAAIPGLFLGAAGMVAMAASIVLVAASIRLLAAALAAVPDWARGFVGGIAGFMGGIFKALPKLQEGGIVKTAGVAYLEPAEVVTPAGERAPGAPNSVYNTYNITAQIREEADIDKLAKKVSQYQAQEYGARVY